MAEAIPTEGGIWELFQGGKDLGNFGQKLVPFGEGMQQYAAAVTGLKPSAISASVPGVKIDGFRHRIYPGQSKSSSQC